MKHMTSIKGIICKEQVHFPFPKIRITTAVREKQYRACNFINQIFRSYMDRYGGVKTRYQFVQYFLLLTKFSRWICMMGEVSTRNHHGRE